MECSSHSICAKNKGRNGGWSNSTRRDEKRLQTERGRVTRDLSVVNTKQADQGIFYSCWIKIGQVMEILVAIGLIAPKDPTLNLVGMEEASEAEPPGTKTVARMEVFTNLINQDTELPQTDNKSNKNVVSITAHHKVYQPKLPQPTRIHKSELTCSMGYGSTKR
eukprot:10749944-Ditylum_brightwellii.AAC.1